MSDQRGAFGTHAIDIGTIFMYVACKTHILPYLPLISIKHVFTLYNTSVCAGDQYTCP